MLRLVGLNVALLALLALCGLAGMEGWLQLTLPASSGESIFLYTLATPRYKVMKPNARIVAWGKELRTNQLGFRDSAAAALMPKAPGEFRIIVLGDSMTVSAGVEFAEIYTTRLEKSLRRVHPGARVLNLAVGGYNIVQYALTLEEVGLALAPDLVLVALYPENDFALDNYDMNYQMAAGRYHAPPPAWYESLYVYRLYYPKLSARLGRMLGRAQPPGEAAADAGWERNAAALRSILDAAARRGVPVAAALLPRTWDLPGERPLFTRVEKLCGELRLACLDLLEPLLARRVDEASLRLNAIDAHPSARYHAVIAEELARHLAAALDAVARRQ